MTPQIFRQQICACFCILLFSLSCSACGSAQGTVNAGEDTDRLVIYATRPLSTTDNVIARFEAETGIDVTCVTLRASDALIRIEGESASPVADLLWPVTMDIVEQKTELFDSTQTYCYTPTALMVNTDTLGSSSINGYEDLLKPEFKGRIAFADPAVSAASYAHLVNMLYAMGGKVPAHGWNYVEQFADQLDATLLSSDEEVYQGVIHGYYTVGLTFAQSSEEYLMGGAHVHTVYMNEGVLFHQDVVCRVKNAPHAENAVLFEQWLMRDRTQVYLQKSQHQTNLFSLRDLLAAEEKSPSLHVLSISDRRGALMRSDWLMRFERIMKRKEQNESWQQ
ncbi:MAG: substrate-binding domain-containing protein [Lachnospiraceae bacterium]|nr:substrate-binding domain-containing protein [Lachnospiraceae bacterium]